MKKDNMGITASDANGLISEQSAIIISETTKNSMNLATPQTLMNRHTNNTMNRQTPNTKGLLGATSSMMVAFILLVAGFGFASVAQAQLSASGPPQLVTENCSPANNAVDPGELVTMSFTVTNTTGSAVNNVLVTLQPSGHVVGPTPNFQIIPTVGANSTATVNFSFTASGVCGVDKVTATLLFQGITSTSATFPDVQLGATITTPNTVSNPASFTIPASGTSGLSSSTITVAGLAGNVKGVKLNLLGLSHQFPDDLNVLLVGPKGQKVFVMGDAGGNVAIPSGSPVNLTFDDAAANSLPDETQIVSGTYKVSQYDTSSPDDDTFPNPAPSAPYSGNLGVFDGQDPNGTWSLYIFDDSAGSTGTLAGGWSLNIPTITTSCCQGAAVPKINPALNGSIPDVFTSEDIATQFTITVSDDVTPSTNLVVTVTGNTNQVVVPNGNISISVVPNSFSPPNSSQRNVTITPAANQNGKTEITLTVTDTDGFSSASKVQVTVNSVNDNPTVSSIPSQAIPKDSSTGVIPFTVTDQPNETPADQLQVLASSSNTALVPNNKIALGGSGNNRTIQVTPNTNLVGSTTITITVADLNGGAANTSFTVQVGIQAGSPFISAVADQNVNEDTKITIPISIGDAETPGSQLALSATSSNSGLVPVGNIAFNTSSPNSPTSPLVEITPVANQFGTTTITLTVTDTDGNTATTTFKATFNSVNDAPIVSLSNITPNTLLIDVNTGNVTGTSLEDFAVTADLIVDDVESGTSGVTLTTVSTDKILVPDANVLVSGSGSNRKLTIIPAANLFSGSGGTSNSVTITLTANDNSGLGNSITTRTLNFQVLAVNDPPQFTKGIDEAVLEDHGASSVPNWSPKLDPGAPNESGQTVNLLVTGVSNPSLFSVQPAFDANNTLSWQTATNQDGTAVITVVAKDNGGTNNFGLDTSAPQTFLITIVGINDQPSFVLASAGTGLNEDTIGVQTINVVTNIDPGAGGAGTESSQTLTFVISNDHPELFKTQPSIKITGTNGALSFELATNAFGTATLQLKLVDNGGTANGGVDTSVTQTFTINITNIPDAPTISTIPNITTGKSKDSAVTLFTVNDPDVVDQSVLNVQFSHISGTVGLAQNFSVGVSGGSRALIITPAPGVTGSETLNAVVTDVGPGSLPAAGTSFTFIVTDLNNPPTITPATLPDITAIEDATSIASPVLTVSDIETVPASLISVTATSSDQTLVKNSGIFIANGVNPGDRIVIITPVADASTTNGVTITVTATDQAVPPGTGALAAQSTSKSFKLFLTPVNDNPTIVASPNTSSSLKKSTQEDVPVVIPFTVTDPEDLNNLTFLITSTNQALVKDANIVLGGTGTNRNVTVTPELNVSGVTDISIGVHDPANAITNFVIFSLTVNPVNDAPVILPPGLQPAYSISENQTLTLTFDIADVETPANLLTLTRSSDNHNLVLDSDIVIDTSAAFTNATRKVTVKPLANKSGTAVIKISITDTATAGLAAVTANYTFTLNVGAVDSPPTITPIADITITKNSTSQGLAFTIGDAETDVTLLTVTPTFIGSPADLLTASGIVISGTGASRTIKVTPTPNKVGTAVITITVTDSIGQTAKSSFTVNVTDVNTAPTIGKIADQVTNEDTDTALIPFTVADAESVNSLTLSASSSNKNLVPDQNVFFGGSGVNRALFVTPAPNEPSALSVSNVTIITVTVSDGQFSASTSFKLTVNAVNDFPTISAIPNQITQIGQGITGIKFIVGDVETSAPFLSVVPTSSNPPLVPNDSNHLLIGRNGTNITLAIFPVAGQSGTAQITITVTDDQGASAKSQFLLVVGGAATNAVPNDFNADGSPDIVFQADDGSVGVWYMNSGPDLLSATLFNPGNVGDLGWRIVGTGDFNNDTKTDLLFQHTDGTLAVWLLNGVDLGSAQLLTPNNAGPGWSVVATGDVNKDGKRDIILQHTDGTLGVWMLNGTSLIDAQLFTPNNPGTGWRVVGSGDFTQLGNTDLVLQNTDGTLGVWYMNGLNLVLGALFNPDNSGDSDWQVAGTVDLNKDGKTDLLFQHADGSVATWLMDGINLSIAELLNPSNPGAGWKLVGPK